MFQVLGLLEEGCYPTMREVQFPATRSSSVFSQLSRRLRDTDHRMAVLLALHPYLSR